MQLDRDDAVAEVERQVAVDAAQGAVDVVREVVRIADERSLGAGLVAGSGQLAGLLHRRDRRLQALRAQRVGRDRLQRLRARIERADDGRRHDRAGAEDAARLLEVGSDRLRVGLDSGRIDGPGDLVLERDHALAELSREAGGQRPQRPVDVMREVVRVLGEEERADAVTIAGLRGRSRHVAQRLDARQDACVGDGRAGERRQRVVAAGRRAGASVAPEKSADQHRSRESARDHEARRRSPEPGAGPLLAEVAFALGDRPEGEAHREYQEKDDDDHRRHPGRRRRADVQQHYGVVSAQRSSSHGPAAHQPSM